MQETSMNTGLPSCTRSIGIIRTSCGHRIRDQGVGGSNPLSPTISFSRRFSTLDSFQRASFLRAFSVHSVQLTATTEARSSNSTPYSAAFCFRTHCCLSLCRTDRPSYLLRDPTNNHEDLWGHRLSDVQQPPGDAP